jgi:uncharacterized damage-inducible protein DinB
MDGALLASAFERNLRIVKAQTEGLSHEDSLAQSPYNINCLNWVVGHIVQSRDVLLGVLGLPVELTPEQFSRYERESDPVTEDGPDVVRLGDLLAAMERQQAALAEVLASMSVADLQAPHTWGDAEMTLLKRVHFQYFHDSYHTGQTDLLRQISGRSDKII